MLSERLTCLSCQSLFRIRLGLCPICTEVAFRTSSPSPTQITSVGVRISISALTCWMPNSNRPLSLLIPALKEKPDEFAWKQVAERFIAKRLESIASTLSGSKNFLLIPCPSRNGRIHSQFFAESIGRSLGLPVYDCLRMDVLESQKQRSRTGRSLRKFYMADSLPLGFQPIFVDDVVTTGASAQAAHRAISPRGELLVWCLAHRFLAEEPNNW